VGPLERRFYAQFAERLGLDPHTTPAQLDAASWPRLRALIGARVATRTRDEWVALFEGSDACVAPVLTLAEAPTDPHNQARGAFVEVDGVTQPAPAPRFTGTPASTPVLPPPHPGEHTRELLAEYEIEDAEALLADAVVG
jgi:alpha-methylacyl-CoA racemase